MQGKYLKDLLGIEELSVLSFKEESEHFLFEVEKDESLVICPGCFRPTSSVHDRRIQKIRDLPIRDKPVMLELEKKRFVCHWCGLIIPQRFDSVERFQRITTRFGERVYVACQQMSVSDTSDNYGLDWHTVNSCFNRYADRKLNGKAGEQPPEEIGVDEFSIKKGHKYQTVVTNLKARRVISVVKDRTKEALSKALNSLPDQGRIKAVCIDMWKPYYRAIKAQLPEAKIVIDRFHVVRQANKAMDKLRKRLQHSKKQGEKNPLFRLRWALLKRPEDLKPQQKQRLEEALFSNPLLKLGYEL